jgi:hypothetical protein
MYKLLKLVVGIAFSLVVDASEKIHINNYYTQIHITLSSIYIEIFIYFTILCFQHQFRQIEI